MLIIETDFQLSGLSWTESIVRIIPQDWQPESHSIIKLTSEMMMRTDPGKQCNTGDIKSRLGMGNCHWLFLSAVIWWKVCVSVWWVRAYYRHDMAVPVQAIPGAIVLCVPKYLWDTVSSCHSGGHDLSRSQLVIAWWCIWRHQASGSEDVLIWLIGGDVRHQPSITQAWAAAIKIVTVITPSASQSENGQISLSHHIMFMVRFLTPHLLAAQCPPLLVLHPPYKAKQNRPHNLLSCVTFCPKNTLTW